MTKAGSKGGNLRDKLDGNELDLSLSDLNEVPVKELAALPKATILDLSCNKLSSLPSDFCGLTHLVKLDLSKNKLQHLPADFGRLVNLQHLDLLNNRLVTLPVSFAQLKNLKWLDLKDNPLDPVLAKVLLLPLLLLCVAGGLVACRVTALQQQPLCTSVNTIYDNAVQGLRRHEILQWILQTDSQQ
uniref:Leucine-rich repeat-containing protein 59 n=1 Tax=Sciurus vulgaris TaxID=55149 RepID=A0A8D2DAR0_SCIVU